MNFSIFFLSPCSAPSLNKSGFSLESHTFAGWNTKADGSGTSYSDGQTVEADTFSGNTTLYAQWIKNGFEFENESTWDNTQPLTSQEWSYYINDNCITKI